MLSLIFEGSIHLKEGERLMIKRTHIKLSKFNLGRLKKWLKFGSKDQELYCPFNKITYNRCRICAYVFPSLKIGQCPCSWLTKPYVLKRVKEVINFNEIENKAK